MLGQSSQEHGGIAGKSCARLRIGSVLLMGPLQFRRLCYSVILVLGISAWSSIQESSSSCSCVILCAYISAHCLLCHCWTPPSRACSMSDTSLLILMDIDGYWWILMRSPNKAPWAPHLGVPLQPPGKCPCLVPPALALLGLCFGVSFWGFFGFFFNLLGKIQLLQLECEFRE